MSQSEWLKGQQSKFANLVIARRPSPTRHPPQLRPCQAKGQAKAASESIVQSKKTPRIPPNVAVAAAPQNLRLSVAAAPQSLRLSVAAAPHSRRSWTRTPTWASSGSATNTFNMVIGNSLVRSSGSFSVARTSGAPTCGWTSTDNGQPMWKKKGLSCHKIPSHGGSIAGPRPLGYKEEENHPVQVQLPPDDADQLGDDLLCFAESESQRPTCMPRLVALTPAEVQTGRLRSE